MTLLQADKREGANGLAEQFVKQLFFLVPSELGNFVLPTPVERCIQSIRLNLTTNVSPEAESHGCDVTAKPT